MGNSKSKKSKAPVDTSSLLGGSGSKKQSLFQYILYEHTLTSLYWNDDKKGFKPFLKRLIPFLFEIFLSLWLIVIQTSSNNSVSFGQSFGVSSGVTPVATWGLKFLLSFFDLSAESPRQALILVLLYGALAAGAGYTLYATIHVVNNSSITFVSGILLPFLAAWGMTQILELPVIIIQYYICSAFCPCCLPKNRK